jgi:hypothetical protein
VPVGWVRYERTTIFAAQWSKHREANIAEVGIGVLIQHIAIHHAVNPICSSFYHGEFAYELRLRKNYVSDHNVFGSRYRLAGNNSEDQPQANTVRSLKVLSMQVDVDGRFSLKIHIFGWLT